MLRRYAGAILLAGLLTAGSGCPLGMAVNDGITLGISNAVAAWITSWIAPESV